MLHYLDDLDSKMESMRAQFEREAEFDSPWTSYNPSLARPLLNPKKFIEKGLVNSRLVEVPKPAAAAPAANSAVSSGNSDDNFGEDTNTGGARVEEAEPVNAHAGEAPEKQSSSPLEALQRKFESHKVTPSQAAEKAR